MAQASRKVKISERGKGSLAYISSLREGKTPSFDGTQICYHSVGKGKPAMMCMNGLGVGSFFWVYLERMFKAAHQVVTWDYRGHGKSELKTNTKNYCLNALVKDAKAVVDKLRLPKAVLIGHSLGVQVSLEFYKRWPERVSGLILCFGTHGRPMDNFFNTRLSRYLFEVCYHIGVNFPKQSNKISRLLLNNPLSFWMGGLLKIMHTGMMSREDCDKYVNHILNVDSRFFTMLLRSAQDHTAEDLLPKIKVPTLIIAGELDQFTPMWLSKKMHRMIPDSELFVMHQATHAGLVEQPDLVNLRIEKFLKQKIQSQK